MPKHKKTKQLGFQHSNLSQGTQCLSALPTAAIKTASCPLLHSSKNDFPHWHWSGTAWPTRLITPAFIRMTLSRKINSISDCKINKVFFPDVLYKVFSLKEGKTASWLWGCCWLVIVFLSLGWLHCYTCSEAFPSGFMAELLTRVPLSLSSQSRPL